jgi:hypothetical protein
MLYEIALLETVYGIPFAHLFCQFAFTCSPIPSCQMAKFTSNSPDRPVSFEICEGHGCQGNVAKLPGFIRWTAQMSFKLLKKFKLSGLPDACLFFLKILP